MADEDEDGATPARSLQASEEPEHDEEEEMKRRNALLEEMALEYFRCVAPALCVRQASLSLRSSWSHPFAQLTVAFIQQPRRHTHIHARTSTQR